MRTRFFVPVLVVLSLGAVGCSGPKQETIVTKTSSGEASVVTEDGKTKSVTMKTSDGETVSATVSEDGKTSTYSSSSGSKVTVSDKLNDRELGVAIYPGAKKAEGAEGISADTGTEKFMSMSFLTPDGFDKVVAFYKAELKNHKESSFSADGKKTTMLSLEEPKKTLLVTISTQKEGGTQFEIVSQLKR